MISLSVITTNLIRHIQCNKTKIKINNQIYIVKYIDEPTSTIYFEDQTGMGFVKTEEGLEIYDVEIFDYLKTNIVTKKEW